MKEKILVINDDEDIREMTQLILQAKGYETLEAINGKIGIDLAVQHLPDLILSDIMMPEMDGFETCKLLKAHALTKDIPVLFFSSLTNPKDKIKGLELGAVDFINNVVDQGELLARVQTHLRIQSLTRSLVKTNEQLTLKQKVLDDDLNAAAIIQRSFLPPPHLNTPSIQLGSIWLPPHPLGGDIFNLIPCKEGKVIFYMLDVSGHDVPSALVTVSVSQFLQQQNAVASTLIPPGKMMAYLNEEYPLERFNRYFTIFYITLDTLTGDCIYTSAGHPPAILLSQTEGLKILDRGGTIIGFSKNLEFEEGTFSLNPGDKVFLYTDGVTEMKNQENEMYGMERLFEVLEKNQHESVEKIISEVHQSLDLFRQDRDSEDDTSMMCFAFIEDKNAFRS